MDLRFRQRHKSYVGVLSAESQTASRDNLRLSRGAQGQRVQRSCRKLGWRQRAACKDGLSSSSAAVIGLLRFSKGPYRERKRAGQPTARLRAADLVRGGAIFDNNLSWLRLNPTAVLQARAVPHESAPRSCFQPPPRRRERYYGMR